MHLWYLEKWKKHIDLTKSNHKIRKIFQWLGET